MADLLKNNKRLMAEFDASKNPEIDINTITLGSNKRVWWRCTKCGFEWRTSVANRSGKKPTGCPACSNKKVFPGHNDLVTLYPEIAKEWDYGKNNGITPQEIVPGSNKKIWWQCPKGHSYCERVVARIDRGTNCPYCSGHRVLQGFNDFATTTPNHLKDWDYKKNSILPTEVTSGSNRKVWWKCSVCGHEWCASVSTKTRSESGCPVCSRHIIIAGKNDFATEHPELLEEWSTRNTIDPTTIASKSGRTIWWECSKCGFLWKSSIYNRVGLGSGCPNCAQRLQTSMPEQVIYQYLSKYYPGVVNRYKTEWLKTSELDIFIPELQCGIEYDGARWHTDAKKDERKSSLLKKHGITLIRVREEKCPTLDNDDTILLVKKYDQNIDSLRSVLERLFAVLDEKYDTGIVFDSKGDWSVFSSDFVFEPLGVSLLDSNPDFVKEWDYEKNGKLRPENVSPNSSRRVWWKCSKCGSSFYSQVHSRNSGTGCPYCSNKKVLKGMNDLDTLYPEVAKEWNYERNNLKPSEILAHSKKRVWWKCSMCGFEWEATVSNRTAEKGTGCPVCAHQAVSRERHNLENDFPSIAAEWDYEKNVKSPCDYLPFSEKRVWWVCPKGHSYDMPIQSRTLHKSNCPICGGKRILKGFNDLQTLYPDIAGEWDYQKNGGLTPDSVFPKTNKRYWWKCERGHSFEATPNYRTSKKQICPYCSGRKKL